MKTWPSNLSQIMTHWHLKKKAFLVSSLNHPLFEYPNNNFHTCVRWSTTFWFQYEAFSTFWLILHICILCFCKNFIVPFNKLMRMARVTVIVAHSIKQVMCVKCYQTFLHYTQSGNENWTSKICKHRNWQFTNHHCT